jgi:membrane associated rhomboid family serine protease
MFNFNITPTVRNLLLANLVVFLAQENIRLSPSLTQLGSLHPLGSPYFHFWQFFTHMFMHADWGHIFFNMLGLLVFGPLLEQHWGGRRFLAFWLMCGVGAGILYEGVRTYEVHNMQQAATEFHRLPSGGDFANFFRTYFPEAQYQELAGAMERNPSNTEYIDAATKSIDAVVDMAVNSPGGGMLGASGAVFGIMFALAYLFPNTEVYQPPIPIPVKAKYLVLFYSVFEVYKGLHQTPGDHVAHFAHIGGLLVAFIILKFWESGRRRFY